MIYLIVTTCINNKSGIIDNENRKNRYILCIEQLINITTNKNIVIIIVENNGLRNTYLDHFKNKCIVEYTNNNKNYSKHKGVTELLDIKYIINKYNIKDDDTIIKLTGRYLLLNDNFINNVIDNKDKYDAQIKFLNVCTLKYMYNDCVLGLFSVKCKLLRNFEYKCIKSPECEFAEYIRQNVNIDRLQEIIKLDLECCFANDLRILKI